MDAHREKLSPCAACAKEPRNVALSRVGRGTAWLLPGCVLAFLPKCPLCLAANVALWTGYSLSTAAAGHIRTLLILLSVAALLILAARRIRGFGFDRKGVFDAGRTTYNRAMRTKGDRA